MPGAAALLSIALADLYRQAQARRLATGTADRMISGRRHRQVGPGGVVGTLLRRASELFDAADEQSRERSDDCCSDSSTGNPEGLVRRRAGFDELISTTQPDSGSRDHPQPRSHTGPAPDRRGQRRSVLRRPRPRRTRGHLGSSARLARPTAPLQSLTNFPNTGVPCAGFLPSWSLFHLRVVRRRRAHVPETGFRTVEANGLTLAYFEEGTGPLVIMLHGFPDTARSWDPEEPPPGGRRLPRGDAVPARVHAVRDTGE